MEPKVYFSDEFIATVLDFERELKAGMESVHPIHINDLVIWNDDYGIARQTFKRLMELYFEYKMIGNDSSLYLIKGLKEIEI